MTNYSRNVPSIPTLRIGLFVCVLSLSTLAFSHEVAWAGDAGPDESKTFAGLWRGEYQDRTFAVVKIDVTDKKFRGAVSLGDINVDQNGEVNEVTREAQGEEEIFDAKQTGRLLFFKAKNGAETGQLRIEDIRRG